MEFQALFCDIESADTENTRFDCKVPGLLLVQEKLKALQQTVVMTMQSNSPYSRCTILIAPRPPDVQNCILKSFTVILLSLAVMFFLITSTFMKCRPINVNLSLKNRMKLVRAKSGE